jgi:large subunit ribosomal protein L17
MRHRKKTVKLGRSQAHRDSLLANQVCSLIEHRRIKTTLAKAKATKPLAERMLTLGKKGDLHARRTAIAYLKQKDIVKKLFTEIAPASADRKGGYTRIIKLGARQSDSAPMAYLEWVDYAPTLKSEEPEATAEATEKPAKAKKAPKASTEDESAEKPAKKVKTKKDAAE